MEGETKKAFAKVFETIINDDPETRNPWVSVEMRLSEKREFDVLYAYLSSGDFDSFEQHMREHKFLKAENKRLQAENDCLLEENQFLREEHEHTCGKLHDLVKDETSALKDNVSSDAYEQPELENLANLTPDQREGLSDLELFLRGNELLYRIQGYAGTGKSFLICEFNELPQLS